MDKFRRGVLTGGGLAYALIPAQRGATTPAPKEFIISLKSFSFDVITVDTQGKETNRHLGQGSFFEEDLGNGIKLEMVSIPGGSFQMGMPAGEKDGMDVELPQHEEQYQLSIWASLQ